MNYTIISISYILLQCNYTIDLVRLKLTIDSNKQNPVVLLKIQKYQVTSFHSTPESLCLYRDYEIEKITFWGAMVRSPPGLRF